MAWQYEVGASLDQAADYRDFVVKATAFLTSKHVATVAINNDGSGYTAGDILTLTHASAMLDARFEVLTVDGSGQILTLRIVASGAFAERAASATVSAGGSGYQVNDVIEVQGGSAREKAKFLVATLSGSAVATVTLHGSGGSYSSTPSNPAATVGVGRASFAGNDAATLTVTYQSIIGTTGLAVTGGTGSAATVDITLVDTGWSCERNTERFTFNSVTDEMEVVLVGDAAGQTNKPYIGFRTGTAASGLDDRYFVALYGMLAHNPALEMWDQPGLSPNVDGSGNFLDAGSYLCFPQNVANAVDFWIGADDVAVRGVINPNPTAITDGGRYQHFYAGFGDRLATETEDPYPMFVGAASRDYDANEALTDDDITGLAECRAPSSGPMWYYVVEVPNWVQVKNNETSAPGPETDVMFPIGELNLEADSASAETVVSPGPMAFNTTVAKRDRTSSTRILHPVPGSADLSFLMPLVVVRKLSATANETSDGARTQLRDVFWVYNDDGSGAAINDFSEDYFEIGNDRYRVFHTHVHVERYQYIAIREDV